MPFDRLEYGRRSLGRTRSDLRGIHWIAAQFRPDVEAEWDRLLHYLVVAFALGCAAFFTSGKDWWLGVTSALAIAALGFAWSRRSSVRALMVYSLIGAFALGASFADIQTRLAMVPIAKEIVPPGQISGTILSVEPSHDGTERVFMRVLSAQRIETKMDSFVARLQAPEPTGLRPGFEATFKAVLFPPPKRSVPDGYDPEFWSYFQGVSAHGRILSPAVVSGFGEGAFAPLIAAIRDVRLRISERISATLHDTNAGFANALLTGLRGGLDHDARDALRIVGLGHVLAISGLHMAIVAGGVFWVMRRLLVAIGLSGCAVKPKQTAALVALAMVAGYLLISGAAIASQRAFIMIVIMFVAVMCGRRALTLRNVAIAAAIVLLFQPQAVMSAGFQMSFAATIALIAGYRRISAIGFGRFSKLFEIQRHPVLRMTIRFFLGLVLTALLAGLATGPIAAFHFNRTTPYGLVANVLAMPVVTFIVMPFGLFSILAMPFGLEALPLTVMGLGLDAVLSIALMVREWPGADHIIAALSPFAIFLLAMTALALAIMARPPAGLIAAGLVIVALGLASHRPADIFINESASLTALRLPDGNMVFLKARGSAFVKDIWLRRAGVRQPRDQQDADIKCDRSGCAIERKAGTSKVWIATNQQPERLLADCRNASIIIASYVVPQHLRQSCVDQAGDTQLLLIDKGTLARQGATEITLEQPLSTIRTARNAEYLRPWQDRPALKDPVADAIPGPN